MQARDVLRVNAPSRRLDAAYAIAGYVESRIEGLTPHHPGRDQVMVDVIVCVCTFRRPEGLRDLFQSFQTLVVPDDMRVRFAVIDNDEHPSSRAAFEDLASALPWPAQYIHEPEPGIPAARNRALQDAGRAGYLVFVDDDETVSPHWLAELWRVARTTNATFVQGPVEMRVAEEKDRWWLKSIFFRPRTFPDGAPRHESWTNNVMVDLDFVSRMECRFDDNLRFDGGSDTLFFQDIIRNGGSGAFAAKAWVAEVQTPARLTWKWAINRQFRYGTTRARVALLRSSFWKALLYCTVRGVAMAAVGTLLLPTILFRGRVGAADSIAYLARAAGVLSGVIGYRRLEYAR